MSNIQTFQYYNSHKVLQPHFREATQLQLTKMKSGALKETVGCLSVRGCKEDLLGEATEADRQVEGQAVGQSQGSSDKKAPAVAE